MAQRYTTPYPPKYKSEAVRLVHSGVSIVQVAKDLGVNDQTIPNWVKQTDLDSGRRKDGLATEERQELLRLRRENRVLREEREIQKRAAAFFAKEGSSTR